MNTIVYRDRTLRKGEIHNHYCERCGAEIHYDLVNNHRCRNGVISRESKLGIILLKSKWEIN